MHTLSEKFHYRHLKLVMAFEPFVVGKSNQDTRWFAELHLKTYLVWFTSFNVCNRVFPYRLSSFNHHDFFSSLTNWYVFWNIPEKTQSWSGEKFVEAHLTVRLFIENFMHVIISINLSSQNIYFLQRKLSSLEVS